MSKTKDLDIVLLGNLKGSIFNQLQIKREPDGKYEKGDVSFYNF